MDFVEIRRRAKERADARGPAAPVVLPPEPLLTPSPAEPLPPPEPPARELDVEPAPRWPGMDGGDLVAALREELAPAAAVAQPAPAWDAAATAVPAVAWTVPAGPSHAPPPPDAGPEPQPVAPPQRWTLGAPAGEGARAPAEPDPLDDFFFDPAEAVDAVLDDLGAPPGAAPQPAEATEARRELLGFFLGAEEYAVDIDRVREVLKAPAITEVPRAPAHVLGVIMVRGEVIAVFDPRRRLALPPARPSRTSRVLVCDGGEGPIGLLVDAVSQVVRLRRSDVEPRPHGVGGVAAEYIAGIGRDRDRMFILLDLRAILRGAPAKEART
jgi:purine-binding chemotaxis protein CheW